uniref:Fibrinogen C-terminal domain-containing protein n=1 Tax=Amphimedon queenslandica TaxID=400682 RepID=A0A1X7UIR2_AMPQE
MEQVGVENKNFYEMELDDSSVKGFDVQQKLGGMPSSRKPHTIVLVALFVIIFLLVVILAIGAATAYQVFNAPSTCPSDSSSSTSSSSVGSPDQYSQIIRLMNSIEGKINSTQRSLNSSSMATSGQFAQLTKSLQDVSGMVNSQLRYAANNSDAIGELKNTLSTLSSVQLSQLVTALQDISTIVNSQLMYAVNNSDAISQLTDSMTQRLVNIVGTLSTLKSTSTTSAGVIDDILLLVNGISAIQNASQLLNTLQHITCKDIYMAQPDSPTGYYHINSETVYCNMDNLCNTTGGWTRMGYFDMGDSTTSCPSGFRQYTKGSIRACGRPGSSASCVSQQIPPNVLSYSEICGRVVGYQYATTDAFRGGGGINSYYVEGVSITYGSPRTHVWTLAAGPRQSHNDGGGYSCPCNTGSTQTVPSFVGSNYYCESGNPNNGIFGTMYTNDPLWDGQGCGSMEQACCAVPGQPWFYRNFTASITDYIEIRVCGDQSPGNEDVPISFYEIYVK